MAGWLAQHSRVCAVPLSGPREPPAAWAREAPDVRLRRCRDIRADADLAGTKRVLERCELFALAESLGGGESLIEHSAIMTHASIPPERRRALDIDDGMIRISVGIEDVEDLCAPTSPARSRPDGRRARSVPAEGVTSAADRRSALTPVLRATVELALNA